MKRIFLSIFAMALALATQAQAIVDNAVIPVAVNVNSIMRMNVTSGGSIEFAFNTIDQYTNGIENTSRYDTKFTVASSVDFKVELAAEDQHLLGSDNPSHQMALDLVAYEMEYNGSGQATSHNLPTGATQLSNTATTIVTAAGGDITANSYTIKWSCGVNGKASGSVLAANLAPDRYSTNVFLVLSEQ